MILAAHSTAWVRPSDSAYGVRSRARKAVRVLPRQWAGTRRRVYAMQMVDGVGAAVVLHADRTSSVGGVDAPGQPPDLRRGLCCACRATAPAVAHRRRTPRSRMRTPHSCSHDDAGLTVQGRRPVRQAAGSAVLSTEDSGEQARRCPCRSLLACVLDCPASGKWFAQYDQSGPDASLREPLVLVPGDPLSVRLGMPSNTYDATRHRRPAADGGL